MNRTDEPNSRVTSVVNGKKAKSWCTTRSALPPSAHLPQPPPPQHCLLPIQSLPSPCCCVLRLPASSAAQQLPPPPSTSAPQSPFFTRRPLRAASSTPCIPKFPRPSPRPRPRPNPDPQTQTQTQTPKSPPQPHSSLRLDPCVSVRSPLSSRHQPAHLRVSQSPFGPERGPTPAAAYIART